MSLFSRLRSLSSDERKTLLLAWFASAGFRAALTLAGFRRARGWAMDATPSRKMKSISRIGPQRTAELLAAASRRGVPKSTCLTRSLALLWLLRKSGFDPQLRIGARNLPAGFEAHAWVECEGHPLNDQAWHVGGYPVLQRH